MESKGESLATPPLLSGASGSTQNLDVDEFAPKPKRPPQHTTPSLEHQEDLDTERPAGRPDAVMMPDGSLVPVSSAAPLTSADRTDVSSVERPQQPALPYSGASTSATNYPQGEPLPPKPDATLGPAPSGGPYMYPPQMYAGAATPGPPPTSSAWNTGLKQAPYGYPPQPAFAHLAGAPERGSYYPSQTYSSMPTSGPAPDHTPHNLNRPVPGPATEGYQQQTPVQQVYPAAQPTPQYPQPYPPYQYPPSQYQLYQPPHAAQYTAPGPTTPYVRYEQPQMVEKKPVRTSKTFDSRTLSHNQYYISICLCIVLVVFCNPLAIICCIPAFYYANKAANENKKDNYDKAVKFEKNAQCLNIGGVVCLVTAGVLFLVVITFGSFAVEAFNTSDTSSSA